jgi:hypothetical protein
MLSFSAPCPELYELTSLQAGLIFVPPGVAGAVAAKLQGLLIDHNYQRMSTDVICSTDVRQRGEDISDFPIEKARLKGAALLVIITVAGTVGYGVALMTRAVST